MYAIETRECLHGSDPGKLLIHVHGAEPGLVEASLELVRDNNDAVILLVVLESALDVRYTVELDFGDRFGPLVHAHRVRECHQGAEVIAFGLDVAVNLLRPPHGGFSGGGHDHRTGLPAQVMGYVAAEVFDDDLHLLCNGSWVQADETHHVGNCRIFIHFFCATQFVADLGPHLVGRVIAEHVEDEAFLDGLPHWIGVEGEEVAIRGFRAEEA